MYAELIAPPPWDVATVPFWYRRREWMREEGDPGPRFVYKYRRLPELSDTGGWDVLRDLLVNHRLWTATPATFVDKMDAHIEFRVRERGEGLEQALLAFYQRTTGCGPARVRGLLRQLRISIEDYLSNPGKIEQQFASMHSAFKRTIGVCSLALSAKENALWEEYAANHAGLALQLAPWLDPVTLIGYSVDYADFDPVIHDWLQRPDPQRLFALLHTKLTQFAFEKEYRIIDPERGDYARKFRPLALTGVIFGAKCEADRRCAAIDMIDEAAETTGHRPQLYQASLGPSARMRIGRLVGG